MAEGLQSSEIQGEKTELEIAEARERNAGKMMDDFLMLKPEEKILFLTDGNPQSTDREFIEILQKQLTARGMEFSEMLADEKTTQKQLLSKTKKYDFVWNSWDWEDIAKDVDFDEFTEFLEEKGKRMAYCPGSRADFLDDEGCLTEDKEAMDFRMDRIEERLRDAAGLKITTSYGTDLRIPLRKEERRWIKDKWSYTKRKLGQFTGRRGFYSSG